MNTEPLLKKAMDRIQAASLHSDVAEIERISRIAKRLKEIEMQTKSIDIELTELGSALDIPITPGNATLSSMPDPSLFEKLTKKGELEVIVDWVACGVSRPKTVLAEYKASGTLVAFLAEINTVLGLKALVRLTQLKVNRGPLISGNPQVDFRNEKRGTPYAYHQIPGTSLFVLTHSSTDEKLEIIRNVWRTLGLPPAGLSVRRAA